MKVRKTKSVKVGAQVCIECKSVKMQTATDSCLISLITRVPQRTVAGHCEILDSFRVVHASVSVLLNASEVVVVIEYFIYLFTAISTCLQHCQGHCTFADRSDCTAITGPSGSVGGQKLAGRDACEGEIMPSDYVSGFRWEQHLLHYSSLSALSILDNGTRTAVCLIQPSLYRNGYSCYARHTGEILGRFLQMPSVSYIHCVSKKVPTFELAVTLSNLYQFSKCLHCWKVYEICYKIHYPPHLGHVATLPWKIKNSNFLQIFSR